MWTGAENLAPTGIRFDCPVFRLFVFTWNTQHKHKHECPRRDSNLPVDLSFYPLCTFRFCPHINDSSTTHNTNIHAPRRDFFLLSLSVICTTSLSWLSLLYNTNNTNTHAPGWIRTRNRNRRSAADPRLTTLGHWDSLDPRPVHPVASRYTDWAIGPTFERSLRKQSHIILAACREIQCSFNRSTSRGVRRSVWSVPNRRSRKRRLFVDAGHLGRTSSWELGQHKPQTRRELKQNWSLSGMLTLHYWPRSTARPWIHVRLSQI